MGDVDKEKCLVEQQRHPRFLRSWDRPDIRREPRRILGWTLARWLLLISNIVVIFFISYTVDILITIIIMITILTIFLLKKKSYKYIATFIRDVFCSRMYSYIF